MLIKDLSASADLDFASMNAVRGGQADPQPGPVPVDPQTVPGITYGGSNPVYDNSNVVTSSYNYHEYYHLFPTFKR